MAPEKKHPGDGEVLRIIPVVLERLGDAHEQAMRSLLYLVDVGPVQRGRRAYCTRPATGRSRAGRPPRAAAPGQT